MIADLDSAFSALADGTRRAIVERLAEGEACVTELAAPFRMSLPAVSKHLRVLEEAGLVRRRREGRSHYLSLAGAPMAAAAEWLEQHRRFWEGSLDRLARLLAEETTISTEQTKPKSKTKKP
jgi:DNA-binding transcriptional ArsR family regulator